MKVLILGLLTSTLAFADGKTTFSTYCATCHGPSGNGDGPAAAGLNPKPADFHDQARKKRSEESQVKIVTDGGASAHLSPVMPAFGEVLSTAQIREVVKFVRESFQQK